MRLSIKTHSLLLLSVTMMIGLVAGKKPKSWCFEKFSECMTNSAEGTSTSWEPCHLRCLCFGFKYGVCEKRCDLPNYPYTCVCHGFGRIRNILRECFMEDNVFDEEKRKKSASNKGIIPGTLEPPF